MPVSPVTSQIFCAACRLTLSTQVANLPSLMGPVLRGEFVAEVDGLAAEEFPFDFWVLDEAAARPRGVGTGREGVDVAEAGWAALAALARLGRPLFRLASSVLVFDLCWLKVRGTYQPLVDCTGSSLFRFQEFWKIGQASEPSFAT